MSFTSGCQPSLPSPPGIVRGLPICPADARTADPPTLEQAVDLLLACATEGERIRVFAQTERSYGEDVAIGLENRMGRLRSSDGKMRQHLRSLGVRYSHDQDAVLRSAIWHRVRGQSFDRDAMAACLSAWNAEMARSWQTLRYSPAKTPEFNCVDRAAREAGRETWSRVPEAGVSR
jgi:hypothetical protein